MILVTGAGGYVGHNLVHRLVQAGKPVRALVHNREQAEVRLAPVRAQIELVTGDIMRPETLLPALEGISAIVHLVAIAIEKGRATYEAINTEGTRNMVEAAKVGGVRRFINMSQNGAEADSPYRFLRSKGQAQVIVAASGLAWTALRPSVIWGPQDEFANVQARLIKLMPLVFPVPGDGQARFQPVWVGDVVEAIAHCLDDEATIGRSYELGGPEVLTYDEIVRRVLHALGTRRALLHMPVPVLALAVRAMGVLPNPPVTSSLLDLLKVDNTVPNNALPTVFQIAPRPFTSENLGYMRAFTARGSLRRFLGQKMADEALPAVQGEA